MGACLPILLISGVLASVVAVDQNHSVHGGYRHVTVRSNVKHIMYVLICIIKKSGKGASLGMHSARFSYESRSGAGSSC